MRNTVEIKIIIDSSLLSDLHKTVTSIINQTTLINTDIFINIVNQVNLPIASELERLKNNNYKIREKGVKPQFLLSINSGDIISKSFLYKGIHFLSKNQCAAVCPEYFIRRVESSKNFFVFNNYNILIDAARCTLSNLEQQSQDNLSPRCQTIQNTCVATSPISSHDAYSKKISFKKASLSNYLLKPSNIRPSEPIPVSSIKKKSSSTIIHRITTRLKLLHKILHFIRKVVRFTKRQLFPSRLPEITLTESVLSELDYLSNIELSLKGYQNAIFNYSTPRHNTCLEQIFTSYLPVTSLLSHDHYDYIMIVPWLIPGGIDLFSINYLKCIAKLHPEYNILTIITNNTYDSLSKEDLKFPDNIDLINLPDQINTPGIYQKTATSVIASIVNITKPSFIHIIASKIGYDYAIEYNEEMHKKSNIIFSSYNYLIDNDGNYIGYHVQELPQAYRPGDIITTDNAKAKDFLINHFGFVENDILLHYQLFDIQNNNLPKPTTKDGFNILWASHIRPEKNPDIVPEIVQELNNPHIQIDCYGIFDPQAWPSSKNPLITKDKTITYHGPYQNFFKDIDLKKYDLFLYTSHTDGMPNVILEASLAGLPIVSSDIGGIKNALGDDAYLVSDTYSAKMYADGIRHVLSHIDEYSEKSLRLRKKLQKEHSRLVFESQVQDMLKRSSKNE